MTIGFSVDFKSLQAEKTATILDQMLATGCQAIQIHLHLDDDIDNLGTVEQIKHFSYRTIHIPTFKGNELGRAAIKTSKELASLIDAHDFTVHPDGLDSYAWLAGEFDTNLNIENMDWRKSFGKNPEDLEKVFEQLPNASWTFDVNHVKTNDSSMELAGEFYAKFKDRLKQYHLSGFGGENLPHTLLADTKQDEIIAKVTDPTKPIIIESLGASDLGRFKEELDYVLSRLVRD